MPIISLKGRNGEIIEVEASDAERPHAMRGGRGIKNLSEKALEYVGDFGSVGEYIMNICGEIYEKYRASAERLRPDELEIQFGIKLSGETGVPFVSKGGSRGNNTSKGEVERVR